MLKWMMLAAILAAMLVACAPAGSAEPTPAGAAVEPTAGQPALRPASGVEQSYPSTDADSAADYPAPAQDALAEGYPGGVLVSPGEVDLSQLTPVPGNPTPQVAPAPGRPGDAPPAAQGLLLEAAILDLSAHLGTAEAAITFISVEPITWPNAALGCPEPGVAYAEVMVEGSRMTLEAGGERYFYHTDGTSQYILCIDGERVSEGTVPFR